MAHMKRPFSPKIDHHSTRYFVYGMSSLLLLFALMIAVLCAIVLTIRAQDNASTASPLPSPYAAYFVAADSDGINQVWGLTLPDGQSQILTHAPQSVFHYALSADHTRLIYVSDHQIWQQTIGQSDAESLLTFGAEPAFVTVAISPDGKSLAYHDKGVWLFNMETRQAEQLLTDVPLAPGAPDVSGLRQYSPMYFLDNDRLLVDVGMWETVTRGIYYLSLRMMQEVAGAYAWLNLLPLYDGRYLVYSGTFVGPGIDGFLLGQPAADPHEPFTLTPILNDFFAANNLFRVGIYNAVEVAPGQLRFVGTSFAESEQQFKTFMGTYDFNTNAFTVDMSPETIDLLSRIGEMSPDGRYAAGYLNAMEVDYMRQAILTMTDLETRTPIELTVPSPVIHFQWADRK